MHQKDQRQIAIEKIEKTQIKKTVKKTAEIKNNRDRKNKPRASKTAAKYFAVQAAGDFGYSIPFEAREPSAKVLILREKLIEKISQETIKKQNTKKSKKISGQFVNVHTTRR